MVVYTIGWLRKGLRRLSAQQNYGNFSTIEPHCEKKLLCRHKFASFIYYIREEIDALLDCGAIVVAATVFLIGGCL